jgi:hypothetical protein
MPVCRDPRGAGKEVPTMDETLVPKQKKCGDCPPLVVPRRSYTPSRPSCIECVEKHLGAAYVLLTEACEGYTYRLRAIGHLFEAEDESQEWPDLHAAIRQARKAYQADGTIPDWEVLATMIATTLRSGDKPVTENSLPGSPDSVA